MYLLFAASMMLGSLPIFLLQHDSLRVKPAIFSALLLVALARRSRVSWTLLLLWNLVAGFAAAATLTSPQWTTGAPLLFALGLGNAALLLTPSMRHHVDLGRSHAQVVAG